MCLYSSQEIHYSPDPWRYDRLLVQLLHVNTVQYSSSTGSGAMPRVITALTFRRTSVVITYGHVIIATLHF